MLERVYFVPADVQPLKTQQPVTNFYHRHAMLALALEGEKRFVPSLLEAPEIVRASGQPASYTVDTVARMRARMESGTRLYFLIGMDAFEQIAQVALAGRIAALGGVYCCQPSGFPLEDVARALPG